MKPHEIAACVHKMFTEHPEKFRQGGLFVDGGYCVLGAATLCVEQDFDDDMRKDLPISVETFWEYGIRVTGRDPVVVNDQEGLSSVLSYLQAVIKYGVEHETN